MTSKHSSTTTFLTLNPDLLRIIGEYMDLSSKYNLKQVNKQTFSPTWPIFLCTTRKHKKIKFSDKIIQDPFYDRESCLVEEENQCTKCGALACLICAEMMDNQSCDLCSQRLCQRCQNRPKKYISQCLCGSFFCRNCGNQKAADPICDECIEFQTSSGYYENDYGDDYDDEESEYETE